MKIKVKILICGLLVACIGLTGCDAFVRKFTRKPKPGTERREEPVLEPQEYVPPAAREQYSQYLLYWQSWQDELINTLISKSSQKRQLGCAREAMKNLSNLRPLLPPARQKKLDYFIADLQNLTESIEKDTYGASLDNNARTAERIRRMVLKEFSTHKVAGQLVEPEKKSVEPEKKANDPGNPESGAAAN